MSAAHSGVSFNHSCLKVPVNPRSKRPSPKYERKFSSKLSNGEAKSDYRETSAVSSINSSVENNYKSVESYLQFYEAIPDYSELHDLSDEEFYSRLKSLKITQKRFCSANDDEEMSESADRPSGHRFTSKYSPEKVYNPSAKVKNECRVSSAYSNSSSSRRKISLKESAMNPKKGMNNSWVNDTILNVKAVGPKSSNSENISVFGSEDKAQFEHCLCKERVCKRCRENFVSESWQKVANPNDGWISDDNACCLKANSPHWKPEMCKYPSDICDCLIDCPFRDDSDYNNESLHHGAVCDSKKHGSPKKEKKFSARPVPLLSRIPLFDKIMAEQEARRRANHNRYSRELQALVQPFSFTKREEEEKQRMLMTRSNPELHVMPKRSQTNFKAKPVPKNLFSDNTYEKMREENLYRALRKKIRAEELLKSASLPPSMAAREKYRSKSLDDKRSKDVRRGYKRTCDVLRREIDFDENIRTEKNQKRRVKPFWVNRKGSNSITDSSADVSPYESVSEPERRHHKRPLSAISINRNNLAAVLRMETVRKRLEKEMADNLEKNRVKQQTKFKERLIRMTPAWRALNYSTEEDLALRVAARKEEERVKKKRYEKLMGSIYGRVHQIPPLFQRQSSTVKQMRSCDKKEAYSYYDQNEGSPKVTNNRKQKSSSDLCYKSNFTGLCKSSESSVTHEKSEDSKLEESDNETGSREDDIDDYSKQPANT